MQPSIESLVALGPLPNSEIATTKELEALENLLADIQIPISDEEAKVLVRLFGPDDCFGLAWSLLRLIETSPGWLIEDALVGLQGAWIDLLRERAD